MMNGLAISIDSTEFASGKLGRAGKCTWPPGGKHERDVNLWPWLGSCLWNIVTLVSILLPSVTPDDSRSTHGRGAIQGSSYASTGVGREVCDGVRTQRKEGGDGSWLHHAWSLPWSLTRDSVLVLRIKNSDALVSNGLKVGMDKEDNTSPLQKLLSSRSQKRCDMIRHFDAIDRRGSSE